VILLAQYSAWQCQAPRPCGSLRRIAAALALARGAALETGIQPVVQRYLLLNGHLALRRTVTSARTATAVRTVLTHFAVRTRVLVICVIVLRRLHHGACHDILMIHFFLSISEEKTHHDTREKNAMNSVVVKETDLAPMVLAARGKVRDVYSFDDKLLIVSTDRLSAFDVILPDPIPCKGKVLNRLSLFWMNRLKDIAPNHVISADVNDFPEQCRKYSEILEGRSVLAKKAKVFPVECVARGYIIGSGWKDYQASGKICGIDIAPGLKQADKLQEPIFTPSTKAAIGGHDENISFSRVVDVVGKETACWLRDKTIELYLSGSRWAEAHGIIIADTKFEFGTVDGERTLVDEALTPDSSRFWPVSQYQPGMSPPSLDKQFVRDYLEGLNWDKKPPAPSLPAEIISKTAEKYREIYKILTGSEL
jgi:phosphoribosylaminoimidazole-succinocarboxamide synthase